jgi:hypothetical protein
LINEAQHKTGYYVKIFKQITSSKSLLIMEINENLTAPQIVGYSDEQVYFAIDEIAKGTDRISLQMLLYKKFGLYDYQADDLVEKIKNTTGKAPAIYVPRNTEDLTQMLVQKGMDRNTAEQTVSAHEQRQQETRNSNSGGNAFDIILGVVILGVGLVITMSSSGVIAYGAIIVGIMRIVKGLSSNNDD